MARYSAVFVFCIVKIDFLKFNLLPNEPIESFWDALWFGIRPFLCSIVRSRRIAHRCLQTMHGAICCRKHRSTASETLCGSLFSSFCVLVSQNRTPMPSNDARRNLLSNERLDTFWDALWLELWLFLYLRLKYRRTVRECICKIPVSLLT